MIKQLELSCFLDEITDFKHGRKSAIPSDQHRGFLKSYLDSFQGPGGHETCSAYRELSER